MSASTIETHELARRIRAHALEMTAQGGGSHIASCFSIADLLAVLYGRLLTISPSEPKAGNRDRFILSKGHAGAALYAVLAECGFFSTAKLQTHYGDNSDLCGHISHLGNPGVEFSTGSLGHGLGVGAGMALAATLDQKQHRVVVMLSDGELDEGSNWEAILFAAHHKLSRLVAVIDYNKYQSLDLVQHTLGLAPLAEKWASFGWSVHEVNGHDHAAIAALWETLPFSGERPICIIAHTQKGKGVSFMENNPVLWHYRVAKGEELAAARKELA